MKVTIITQSVLHNVPHFLFKIPGLQTYEARIIQTVLNICDTLLDTFLIFYFYRMMVVVGDIISM